MHFDATLSLGNVLVIITLLGLGAKFHTDWIKLNEKVGLMWYDYAARHGMADRRSKPRERAGD